MGMGPVLTKGVVRIGGLGGMRNTIAVWHQNTSSGGLQNIKPLEQCEKSVRML